MGDATSEIVENIKLYVNKYKCKIKRKKKEETN